MIAVCNAATCGVAHRHRDINGAILIGILYVRRVNGDQPPFVYSDELRAAWHRKDMLRDERLPAWARG